MVLLKNVSVTAHV